MDPEKREFLDKVMSRLVEDETKTMKDIVEVSTACTYNATCMRLDDFACIIRPQLYKCGCRASI
jgi:hypothetical protein